MANKEVSRSTRPFTPILLNRKQPVPSDIEIAQAAVCKPIRQVAEEFGTAAGRDRVLRGLQSQGKTGSARTAERYSGR